MNEQNTRALPKMLTIKETAQATGLHEYFVRQLVKQNRVTYVKAGCKTLINLDRLVEFLNEGEGGKHMTAAERISNALRTGESNAVSLADMCIISGLDNRHTRLVIEDMRRKGAVICSSECGYFYPADRSELSRYVNRERSRANSISQTLRSAKRLLEEWKGQE